MIYQGNCLDILPTIEAGSVNTCVTSPPYFGLRDYGHGDQLGAEKTPEEFVSNLVNVFREVKRVLMDDGTLWLNLGDSYTGSGKGGNPEGSPHQKQSSNRGTVPMKGVMTECFGLGRKQLLGIPWRVAFALQADGWILRQDIIWSKPNPMPESVTDRCTKSHEYIFLFSKQPKYYFDNEAIKEKAVTNNKNKRDRETTKLNNTPGRTKMMGLVHNDYDTRNKRSVWTVTAKPYKGAHFATFPIDLIEPCILAGCPSGGTVLDPFGGSGTMAIASLRHGRQYILCELNEEYVKLARNRVSEETAQMVMNY